MEAPTSTIPDHNPTTPDHNGTTTSDQNNPIADKNDRTQFLDTLYKKGGFMLACKTLVMLYRVTTTADSEPQWEMVGHGILTILSKRDKLTLLLSDSNSAAVSHKFDLRPPSARYAVQKPHFHSFVTSSGDVYGLAFVEVSVACKVSRVLHQLMGGGREGEEGVCVPQVKRGKLNSDKYSEWVIINKEDVPPISGVNEVSEGEGVEGGTEETDFGLFSKKRDKKENFEVDEISSTSYFRHLPHTGDESANQSSLKGAEPGEGGENSEPQTGTFERGTKRSSSFMEFVSPEVPPSSALPHPGRVTASSSTSGSFASTFSGSSLSIPEPPDHSSDDDTLLSQINTFDRKNLHHVTDREMVKEPAGDEKSFTAVLLRGFDQLLPKLQALHQVFTVASINSEGEEEGFDDFDGAVFE